MRPVWIAVGAAVSAAMLASCSSAPDAKARNPLPSPTFKVNTATCTDKQGDGGSSDLKNVTVTSDGNYVRVAWNLTKAQVSQGTRGFYLNISSKTGDQSAQLGVKLQGGQTISHFFFDMGTSSQTNVDSPVQVSSDRVQADFSAIDFALYDPGFDWYATTTVDGKDVDSCPDKTDPLHPNTVAFTFP